MSQSNENISFITFTNYGYLHYTKNLILSLERCNFPLPLKVYCIDQKAFDGLNQWNKNIHLDMLNDETNTNESIVGWKEKGWNTMAFSKLKCIYKELFINPYVFFTDSDIVFEKDCLQYLTENIQEYDMITQQPTEESDYILNSGFMFIQSNENTKEIFNWHNIDITTFTCDQDYLNDNKSKINYNILPSELFPIEVNYYQHFLLPV